MKVQLYSQKGNELKGTVTLDDTVFGQQPNKELLSQYVYVYNSNQRSSVASTKDRSEVRGGGRKPWRQKGTGRARHGSIRSPIWVGGGVTFGPRTERNFKKSFNKKMKQQALRVALSMKLSREELKVLKEFKLKDKALTKQAAEFVEKFNSPRRVTLVVPNSDEGRVVNKAFGNIKSVDVVNVAELNAYDVIAGGEIFIDQASLDYMKVWTTKQ